MSLESLGADTSVQEQFEPHAARGLVLARVAAATRERFRLITAQGEFPSEISGALRHKSAGGANMAVTGDWAAARIVNTDQAIIEAVLPRKTLFSRRAAGRREDEQPIAANIDLVFLVCGLDGDYNLRRLERYLTLAAESGAEPVVVLNKSDLCPDIASRLAETAAVGRGAPVIATTTTTPGGLDGLRTFLAFGRTVALLGSSGVGESAIVNFILGQDRQRTNPVRASDSRGRHTTTQRELIPLPAGGALIDTPGMRELQLWASQQSVDRSFDEIAEIASACRFRNCSHSGESGCAVAQSIEDGELSEERWISYRKLLAEAKRHEEMTDRLAAAESKRRLKAMHKGMREFYRRKDW